MAGIICLCTYAVAAGADIRHASAASSSAAVAGDRAGAAAHDAVTFPHVHRGLHISKADSQSPNTAQKAFYRYRTACQPCRPGAGLQSGWKMKLK